MKRLAWQLLVALFLVAATLISPVAQSARAATVRTVALSGEQAPGMPEGTVFGDLFDPPVLNDAGQTTFLASQNVWSEGTGSLALAARLGDHAPGTPDGVNFSSLNNFGLALNRSDQTERFATIRRQRIAKQGTSES